MTLIDGDRIVTAQLYDDEHEEFTEEKMSIIEYVNAYTDEGVTAADDVLNKIRAEIEQKIIKKPFMNFKAHERDHNDAILECLDIIERYRGCKSNGECGMISDKLTTDDGEPDGTGGQIFCP